jgi:heme oxygenase
MLSEKLKENTQKNHQQLEKVLITKLKSIRSTAEYAGLIKYFYGYFGGLETRIEAALNPNQIPDSAGRRKTGSLANDLTFLGADIPAKAGGNALPAINNHLEALGALYVIEGSTLGGKIISKMMQQQLGMGEDGLSFFLGYGDNSMPMWEKFKAMLNRQANNPEEEAVVIAAANQTFLKFGEWFAQDQ